MNLHTPTESRALNHLKSFLVVLLVFGAMVIGQLLDNADHLPSLVAEDVRQAELDAQLAARLDHAARAACHDVAGSNTVPVWTPQGELMCPPMLSVPIARGGQP